ncbi:hypothetical protein, partial [Mycobacterium pseudoshottsii]|uniref:hypothetical protein n=1 Tax=Mycobacterium pseudoshottsii TaxID=265949 RepID=UPI003FD6E6CC
VTNSIVLQIARAYTPAPIARHQRSSTQLTSLLINNAGALGRERLARSTGGIGVRAPGPAGGDDMPDYQRVNVG